MAIKNLIFDMGGVILNIDMKMSKEAFRKLGVIDPDNGLRLCQKLIADYGRGLITSPEFVGQLKQKLDIPASDKEIISAWNAMLLDLPTRRLEVIEQLKKQGYRIFILSNTNELHLEDIEKKITQGFGVERFNACFEKQYYSHLTHLRKPEEGAYLQILQENGLNAAETVYVDDNKEMAQGAEKVRIHGLQMQTDMANFDFGSYLKQYEVEQPLYRPATQLTP